jgi:hypothetical protein
MKAEITREGYIRVIAETPEEAFAIKHLTPVGEDYTCETCGYAKSPMLFDCTILNGD